METNENNRRSTIDHADELRKELQLAGFAALAAPIVQADEDIRSAAAELERQADSSLDMRPEFRRAIANVHTALATHPAKVQGADLRPTDDELWDQTMADRDHYHEVADDLAAQIAAITEQDIGEHSSANDPWRNAMIAADEFIAKQLRDFLAAHAVPPIPAPTEAQAKQTDLSKRLRKAVADVGGAFRNVPMDREDVIGAADEIDRYYAGMLNWKATAEAKDRERAPTKAAEGSIGDDDEFRRLMDAICWCYVENYLNGGSEAKLKQRDVAKGNFVTYIDTLLAASKAAPAKLTDLDIMRLRDVGAEWMSQDGRDSLDDWIVSVQAAAIAAQPGEKA